MRRKGNMNSVLEVIRGAAMNWIKAASLEELVMTLPAKAFDAPLAEASEKPKRPARKKASKPAETPAPKKIGAGRIPKRPQRSLKPTDKEAIIARLGSINPESKEYIQGRDAICRELGLTRRQVSSFLLTSRTDKTKLTERMAKARKAKSSTPNGKSGKPKRKRGSRRTVHATMTL